MIGTELLVVCVVLAVTLAFGLLAHEWAHTFVLRFGAVEYTISYLPNRGGGLLGSLRSRPWAVVRPHPTGTEPPWILRAAALAPLALAVPALGLVATGYATEGPPVVTAATVGWLACAIPSPRDFSVAFHAHRALRDSLEEYDPRSSRTD
ncbi:hypothetical protein [Natronococcus jeotgali]|uniref:Peptidase M50 n=1 Tax=Natronococcus jeotgali DSM 18795 TaxID=1227498 RepID=L9XZZ0_9EURY|nr:hypothetical protein [Natronococcus jeotgali]ELY66183.1 hypothetical protein C492_01333 [Natronococcus jeotgali DSM 18795]